MFTFQHMKSLQRTASGQIVSTHMERSTSEPPIISVRNSDALALILPSGQRLILERLHTHALSAFMVTWAGKNYM